jgi:hypothetical protein
VGPTTILLVVHLGIYNSNFDKKIQIKNVQNYKWDIGIGLALFHHLPPSHNQREREPNLNYPLTTTRQPLHRK